MCILTWDLILNITLPGTQPCFCAQRGETELGKGLENKFSEEQMRELGGLFQPQRFCKIKAENLSNPCKSCSPGHEPTPSPAQWAQHRGVVQHLVLPVGCAQCSLRQINLALYNWNFLNCSTKALHTKYGFGRWGAQSSSVLPSKTSWIPLTTHPTLSPDQQMAAMLRNLFLAPYITAEQFRRSSCIK